MGRARGQAATERQAFHHCLTPGHLPSSLPRAGGWSVCVSPRPGWGRHTGIRGTTRWLGVRWPNARGIDLQRKAKQDSDTSPENVGPTRGDRGRRGFHLTRGLVPRRKGRLGRRRVPCASPCLWVSVAPPHTHVRAHLLHSTLACLALAHASVI